MTAKTTHEPIVMHGREIDDAQVDAWAQEAEVGYDVDELLRKRGRPRVGDGPTALLQVRVPRDRLDVLDAIAQQVETSRSVLAREAIEEYIARHS